MRKPIRFLLAVAAFSLLASAASAQVKIKETKTTIPTYLVGDPELDPYFFTGRTYQGAAGHIYPCPIYDILTDDRVDREYKYLTLYVLGRLSYDEMVNQLEIAIHQFAKRQMTWFRGMERRGFTIHWIDGTLPVGEQVQFIMKNS